MPGHITLEAFREEFERYGEVVDAYIKEGCDPNRQWGFVVYQQPSDAMHAKECTDKILYFPDSEIACEVKISKPKEGAPSSAPGPVAGAFRQPARQPAPPA